MAQSGHTELHRTCPLLGVKRTSPSALHMSAFDPKRTSSGRIAWGTLWATQFRAAPYRLRTAPHGLPISSCGAAAKIAPHFHKAAALSCWGRWHSRIAAYLHGIRSIRIFFRSNAVAVSPLVMHTSATTVNDRIMRAPRLCPAPGVPRAKRHFSLCHYLEYWNAGSILSPSFVPPGSTILSSANLRLS